MHPDLASHLHTDECNELITLLKQCHEDNPFKKVFGVCNEQNRLMTRCLQAERVTRQKENSRKSQERKEKLRQAFKEDREKKAQ